jgi:hypothetical protein
MARELVTQKGVGDYTSAVWKAVQEQHARPLPPSSTIDDRGYVAPPALELVRINGTAGGLLFGSPMPKGLPSKGSRWGAHCRNRLPIVAVRNSNAGRSAEWLAFADG